MKYFMLGVALIAYTAFSAVITLKTVSIITAPWIIVTAPFWAPVVSVTAIAFWLISWALVTTLNEERSKRKALRSVKIQVGGLGL